MQCVYCPNQVRELPDRDKLAELAGELSTSSLIKAVPLRVPVCMDCAVNRIIDTIVREVHWCEARGIRWGRRRSRSHSEPPKR